MITLDDGKTYLTISEAAKELQVTQGRVWHFITDGRLKKKKILGRTVFLASEVRKFARTRRLKPGPIPTK